MKLKLFEYCILLHPEEKKDGKTVILKDVARSLAKDEKEVGLRAAREIPATNLDDLEYVEIIVRPF